ncbi:MAG TPA: hypothetical protein VD788_02800 [Candidatus Polarisedimenticolaceae bacterium]|nr:hypothetical protein [Candidatus Polarisedimenticolaceae bacterium]
MSAGGIAAVIVGLSVVAWVLAPLLRKDAAESERIGSAVSEERDLRSRREMLVAALKDLEDDRSTGKVDDTDYARSRTALSAEAVEIMKQLDALEQARRTSQPVALPTPRDEPSGPPA